MLASGDTVYLCICVICWVTEVECGGQEDKAGNIIVTETWLRFLVGVEQPWNNCSDAVETPFLDPSKNLSTSPNITTGQCTKGQMEYKVIQNKHGPHTYTVTVAFNSTTTIAKPASCRVSWNGTYLTPLTTDWTENILPGCYAHNTDKDSHKSHFWFYIMEWQ